MVKPNHAKHQIFYGASGVWMAILRDMHFWNQPDAILLCKLIGRRAPILKEEIKCCGNIFLKQIVESTR